MRHVPPSTADLPDDAFEHGTDAGLSKADVDWTGFVDARRTKPRVALVLTPEEHEMGKALAQGRGVAFSALVGQLIREETKRTTRRGR